MLHPSIAVAAALGALALATPTAAQERPPVGGYGSIHGPFHYAGRPANPASRANVVHAVSLERVVSGTGAEPGPLDYGFTRLNGDRASLRVKLARSSSLDGVNRVLGQAIQRQAAIAGYENVEVVGGTCRRYRDGEFAVRCDIELKFDR